MYRSHAKVVHRGYIFLANLQAGEVHVWINTMQTGAKANNVLIIVFSSPLNFITFLS